MEKILGQALKKEREMRGLSLADIANETRIGTRYLQSLENEDFSMFPGIFYIRYYIKNYLKACGADETVFFNTYYSYLKTVLDKKGEPPPDQYLNKLEYVKFKRRKTILIILLLLIALAALFYWFLGSCFPTFDFCRLLLAAALAGGRKNSGKNICQGRCPFRPWLPVASGHG
jgi:cytoskeleton protein RodZ